jgi:WD40 repeat protein
LHAVRAGYIKRRADDLLFDTVISGRYAHVLAPDRSGKTSLVAATAARLEGNGCKVAILDLEQIGERDGGTDAGRWYYNVAYRLLRQLRIRYDLQEWWQDKTMLSNRQRLLEFYAEVILEFVPEPIVIFFDQIQCIENLPYADELLASIRAAHNARATNPEFTRLAFVLLGECDPVSLIDTVELSPFNITQAVILDDFSRADLNVFATELNLSPGDAAQALDRIFYWTNGQPYLSQKLARAVSRETEGDGLEGQIDRIAVQQLAGRAALHSEPHMSHIHRAIVNDKKRFESLLNLYGKLRKGIEVPADLGSALQRRLMAIGLVTIDDNGSLMVRNRLYEAVFTARWANENLPVMWRVPSLVTAGILLFALIPFWYTQWLPTPYVRSLVTLGTEVGDAQTAYRNLRSFPGHGAKAENLYRQYLQRRADAAVEVSDVHQLASMVAELPESGRLAEEFVAKYWDRRASVAMRREDRDAALLASIEALILSTAKRRQRAAVLVADDYPLLLATLPQLPNGVTVFDPLARVLTTAVGAVISQWTYTPQGVQERASWTVTALDVVPLVRRVIVNRVGAVRRIGLTLNLSHGRTADLRIKLIAPSGRAIEVRPMAQRASSADDLNIASVQLADLLGETLSGTWTISIRDEALGVAGQLVGWNLVLNSQGAVEHFQRGLNIPDPVERATNDVWFDDSGRYAVARAIQSNSARIWDLAYAEPVRAIAVAENETIIGLDSTAHRLLTATEEHVNIWDTLSGDNIATLAVSAAGNDAVLTRDGAHLFVVWRTDLNTRLELWSLDEAAIVSEIVIAGVARLVSIDASGSRVAIADFERAARVWDFRSGELLSQFDLSAQPDDIKLSADGRAFAATYPDSGVTLWSIRNPRRPILQASGSGRWYFRFSPSGNLFAVGRTATGFQIHNSADGRLIGPSFGVQGGAPKDELLAFSDDEQIVLTGSPDHAPRFWRAISPDPGSENLLSGGHSIWNPSADRVMLASPDGSLFAFGDATGHVHIVPSTAGLSELAEIGDDISFLGHNSEVRLLAIDQNGSLVASAAEDGSVRVWKTDGGEPLPYVVGAPGLRIRKLEFSPDAARLAILHDDGVSIIDVANGKQLAIAGLGDVVNDIVFSAADRLYVGSENGALSLVNRDTEGRWQIQLIWQDVAAIRLLRASPRGDKLILVDSNDRASLFDLSESRIAAARLQLPAEVQEVIFDSNGTRAYFRTPRWVHRSSASVSGLHWIDALPAPLPLQGGGLILGSGISKASSSYRVFLPTARNSYIELTEVDFARYAAPGLFGSREDLLQEWQQKIGAP